MTCKLKLEVIKTGLVYNTDIYLDGKLLEDDWTQDSVSENWIWVKESYAVNGNKIKLGVVCEGDSGSMVTVQVSINGVLRNIKPANNAGHPIKNVDFNIP